MRHAFLGWMTIGIWVSVACEKSNDSEPVDPEGLGGGDGDFVVDPTGDEGEGTGKGDGDGVELPPPLARCAKDGNSKSFDAALGEALFDDFDDGDDLARVNLTSSWYDYDDGTSSQSPSAEDPGGWVPEPGGMTRGGYALHAKGQGFTGWGSGQGSVPAWDVDGDTNCLFDASAFDGISFWIRGNIKQTGSTSDNDAEVMKFGVTEPAIMPVEWGGGCSGEAGECWDWHKARITLGECWHRYSFRFDELKQDGWGQAAGALDTDKIVNLNFEITQGHSYEYWLDEVTFFVGETPDEEELCAGGEGGAGGGGGSGG